VVHLRQASSADRDALVALHLALYVDHRETVVPSAHEELYAYRDFESILRGDVDAMLRNTSTSILVAEEAGAVVGYVTGYVKNDPRRLLSRKGVVGDWYVLPEMRGRGVGRQLLEALLRVFEGRGCSVVETTTWPGNEGARSAFEAAGFAEILITYRRSI